MTHFSALWPHCVILYSPGFELPTSGSAYHCHYHLTMKAMGARSLILVLIISSSPQAPLM